MWPVYEKLLARPDMQTVVAYEKRDPSFLYGFIAADPTEQAIADKEGACAGGLRWCLYVFIKQNYRGHGYARGLFAAAGIDPSKPFLYASNSQQASRLAAKIPLARFNPLCVRFPKEKAA
jgi:GNAT superfamily N-acetyltransferase